MVYGMTGRRARVGSMCFGFRDNAQKWKSLTSNSPGQLTIPLARTLVQRKGTRQERCGGRSLVVSFVARRVFSVALDCSKGTWPYWVSKLYGTEALR